MLTAAAEEELFSHNDFHSSWLFWEDAFEVSLFFFFVDFATSQRSHTRTQATTDALKQLFEQTHETRIDTCSQTLFQVEFQQSEDKKEVDTNREEVSVRQTGDDVIGGGWNYRGSVSSSVSSLSLRPHRIWFHQVTVWGAANCAEHDWSADGDGKQAAQQEEMKSVNFDPEAENHSTNNIKSAG